MTTKRGSLMDSVHTDAICSKLAEALPLNKSQIIETVYPDTDHSWDYGERLKFPYEIKTFDEAITWKNRVEAPIIIWIYTLEDVSGLSEASFNAIPEIQKLTASTANCKITIMSLADTSALDSLKGQLEKNPNNITMLGYESTTDKIIADFFSEYHMKSAMIAENQVKTSAGESTPLGLKLTKITQ